jgi:TP901 family phage tail tape measure protein
VADITSTIRLIGDASSVIAMYNLLGRSARQFAAQTEAANLTRLTGSKADGFLGLNLSTYDQGIKRLYKINSELASMSRNARLLKTGFADAFERDDRGRFIPTDKGQAYDKKRPFVGSANTEVDLLNRTLRTTYDLFQYNADGVKKFHSTFDDIHGDYNQIEAAERRISQIRSNGVEQLREIRRELNSSRAALREVFGQTIVPAYAADRASQAAIGPATNSRNLSSALLKDAQRRVAEEQARLAQLQSAPVRDDSAIARSRRDLTRLESLLSERRAIYRTDAAELARLRGESRAAHAALLSAQNSDEVQAAQSRLESARQARRVVQERIRADTGSAEAARAAAQLAPPPQPAIARAVQQQSPSVYRKLQSLQIPINNAELAQNFQLTEDVTHGTRRLTGQWTTSEGVLKSLNLEYDKSGKLITRFGGHMSGLQNALNQTIRNMTKVIYWTAATTAVIGTLGAVGATIGNIIELDKTLNRLSVTAQLTHAETQVLFNGLAQVAFDTATPLQEIVNAADDIALATRKAGQSTDDWHEQILGLSKAVGILTNLTGLDTVKATDLLTSTMKQLNLEAEDLTGVLNKITAVGGGQAVAIADIIEGLGQMAEAASSSGLSLDQTIATVQVLSQVTSKSSKEVATSFKNLTGSLGSPGAKKVLAKYDIDTHDVEGKLRNILDVYRDVSDKIASGVIAEGDVQGVLRGLAGGPRRLPDAAALLSNIDSIDEVTARSARASNEALLANAKVLDTLQAKITQFKVVFDQIAFTNFGAGLKEAIETLIDVFTGLLNIASKLPVNLVAMVVKFGAILLAIKGIVGIGRFFKGILAEWTTGFGLVSQSAVGAAASITAANAAAAKAGGTFVAGAGGVAATAQKLTGRQRLGGVAAIGGGAALGAVASSGGGPIQAIGGALSGAGLGALASPVLIPHLKAAGVVMLALGTAIQFFGEETKEATKDTADLRQEILGAISSYEAASQTIQTLTVDQRELLVKYNLLTKTEKDRIANQALINTTLQEYGATSKGLIDANAELIESYAALDAALAKSGESFKNELDIARAGGLSVAERAKLAQKVATAIFTEQNPEFTVPTQPDGTRTANPYAARPLPVFGAGEAGASFIQRTSSRDNGLLKTVETVKTLDSALLQSDEILKLFSADGKVVLGTFNQTAATVDVIRGRLTDMAGEGNEVAKAALKAFNDFVAGADALSNAKLFVGFEKALISSRELVGEINAEQAKGLRQNADLYEQLITRTAALPTTSVTQGGFLVNPQEQAQREIQERFLDSEGHVAGGEISIENARFALEKAGLLNSLKSQGKEITDEEVARIAIGFGINVKITEELRAQIDASEELVESQEHLNELRQQSLSDLAAQTQEIYAQFRAGEITAAERDTQLADVNANQGLQTGVVELFDSIAGNQGTLDEFTRRLGEIPGLQDIVGKNAGDAADLLFTFIDSLDLSGQEAKELLALLAPLATGLKTLPTDVEVQITAATKVNLQDTLNKNPQYQAALQGGNQELAQNISESYAVAAEAEARGANVFVSAVDAATQAVVNALVENLTKVNAASAERLDSNLASYETGALEDIQSKLVNLQAQKQGGEFTTKVEIADYTAQLNQLQALQQQIEIVIDRAREANAAVKAQGGDLGGAVKELAGQLTGITGLADAQSLTTDQLIARMFALAETYGLNGQQIDKLGGKIVDFLGLAKKIADIRSKFTITANLDLRQAIKALQALKTVQTAVRAILSVFNAMASIFGGKQVPLPNLAGIDDAIKALQDAQNIATNFGNPYSGGGGTAGPGGPSSSGSKKQKTPPDVSTLDIPEEILNAANRDALIQEAIKRAKALQSKIPGANAEAKNDIVELLKGTQRILEVRGVKDDLLRRALEELAEIERKKLEFETKADTIRRIRVGGGDFSALANVPLNSKTGISLGGEGNINITLNVNGSGIATPAQLQQLADMIAASLKRQIANG